MKRINEYRKLFGVEHDVVLKTLKKTYRDLIKEWHPDKLPVDDVLQEEAEVKSREIIDGYHFLVSIAPETIAFQLGEYKETTATFPISDLAHKGLVLEICFANGSRYEYFGVSKQIYLKMVNSDKLNRFAKRNIYPHYTYRKIKCALEAV